MEIPRQLNLLALLVLMVSAIAAGCTSPGKRTAIGAGAGGAAGAAIGGAVGGWKGAGIGVLAGAATGAAVGNYLDRQHKELQRVADTKRVKDGLLVNLKNDLLFETGESDLKSNAKDQLVELGQILAKYPEDRIRVAGYTDSTGAEEFNQRLSERRADTVRAVLKDQGVKDEQLLIKGFGEDRPVASNNTAAGRAKNRRVELIIDVPQENADAVREKQRVGEV